MSIYRSFSLAWAKFKDSDGQMNVLNTEIGDDRLIFIIEEMCTVLHNCMMSGRSAVVFCSKFVWRRLWNKLGRESWIVQMDDEILCTNTLNESVSWRDPEFEYDETCLESRAFFINDRSPLGYPAVVPLLRRAAEKDARLRCWAIGPAVHALRDDPEITWFAVDAAATNDFHRSECAKLEQDYHRGVRRGGGKQASGRARGHLLGAKALAHGHGARRHNWRRPGHSPLQTHMHRVRYTRH